MSKKKIVIIGAGISGVSCGQTLKTYLDSNHDIVILEGRARVGGRLWTKEFQGRQVDIGACWIEGYDENPLKQVCQSMGINVKKGGKGGHTYVDIDGKKVASKDIKKAKNLFYGAFHKARQTGRQLLVKKKEDESLQKCLNKHLNLKDASEIEKRLVKFMQAGVESFNGGEFSEMSGMRYGDGPEFNGASGYVMEGLGTLCENLSDGLTIKLNQNVCKVDYSGKNEIKVETTEGEIHKCDYVVCTVPLGVLKAKDVVFHPPLPKKKSIMIDRLGFGLMNKIVLVFSKRFWEDSTHARFDYISDEKGKYKFWTSLSYYYENDESINVLICLTACNFAKNLEKLSDEEVKADVMDTLRVMFGGKEVPDPKQFFVSRFLADKFSRGGYTFLQTGEHTSEHYSAVHGAYLSGIREGKKIAKLVLSSVGEDGEEMKK